jgi:tight adherence protein C
MNSSWWFDLAILLLLCVELYSLYSFARNRISQQTNLSKVLNEPDDTQDARRQFSLYPKRLIRHAGVAPQGIQSVYWLSKVTLALAAPCIALSWQTALWPVTYYVVLAVIAFCVPDVYLIQRRRTRRRHIQRSLGYFIDLLVIFQNSGMSLSQSFQRAAAYGLRKNDPLCHEVGLISLEIASGRDRNHAFSALADRTGVIDAERLAAVLGIGFKSGSPVSEILEAQSDLLRNKQVQQGTELANRKSLESMFPLMLVSLPIFFVLVFFPAAVQIYDAYLMFTNSW